ncbi:DciA family protein [Lutimaribacter sp. EGI FJ00015]|uniref:DciA family protein n=1 Tax=Lutimaribacter degradans TaxID=2945989 RepID=A0ACC5ZZP0_9RHOB|nr:DciA family protein [Lutimaribacter sp. EGI FJ00013]MCM2563388.1 DciA family protein [Lutimaribacter sp. EGI FJ00013]MCO0614533.1 DciA family protein [Lutimaribacter sp. EGI FJ00015]MCO0637206.1 DciA family protein [Lutimaribacter sp. EGI FJ00014]
MSRQSGTTYGFSRTSSLLQPRIRRASEGRGFAVTRLLTHWEEVVGAELAQVARPVEVKYGRQGFGATLTVLTTGAQAPMLEMQKEKLREKVNAVYGYNAISRVRIAQTAPTGFAEGQAQFQHRPKTAKVAPDPEITQAAAQVASDVQDGALRDALEHLARNVLSKAKQRKGDQ